MLGRQTVPEGLLCDVDMLKDNSSKGEGPFSYTVGLMCDIHSDLKIDLKKIRYIGL